MHHHPELLRDLARARAAEDRVRARRRRAATGAAPSTRAPGVVLMAGGAVPPARAAGAPRPVLERVARAPQRVAVP